MGLIFRGEGRKTHSLWFELLANYGLVGLGLFLLLLAGAALSIANASKMAKAHGDEQLARLLIAFGGGMLGYFCAMTFMHEVLPRALWLMVTLGLESSFLVALRFRKVT